MNVTISYMCGLLSPTHAHISVALFFMAEEQLLGLATTYLPICMFMGP